jgi:nitrate reductase gamma subunit
VLPGVTSMIDDEILFAIAPYVATVGLVLVLVVRCAKAVRVGGPIDERPERPSLLARLLRAVSLIGLLTLHVFLLVAPGAVLLWNRRTPRLLLLEATGLCLGLVCLAAVARAIRRHLIAASTPSPRPLIELVALALVAVAVTSGVALAVGYRWASSWSVVTLTPYASSIVLLRPRIELVAATPFLVRLHVFSTFAVAPLLPFTLAGAPMVALVGRCVRGAARSAGVAFAPAMAAFEETTRRVLRHETTWGDEEN